MKKKIIKKNGREKKFIGAIVGAVAGIAGGIISGAKKKKADAAAFKQAQEEQNRIEGVQQAAAMSSSYANQDYVNQYQDKITLKNGGKVKITKGGTNDRFKRAKQFKAGGRKKNAMGSVSDTGTKLNTKPNTASIISSIGQGVTGGINTANALNTNNLGNLTTTELAGLDSVITNRNIATEATAKRFKPNSLDVQPVNNARTTAEYGVSLGQDVAGAAGGIGGLVGSLFQSSKAPKTIKKADGFSFAAPKTGLVQNSYQTDENGNPITALNSPNVPIDPNLAVNPAYRDRIDMARMGGKRTKVKSK